MVLEKIALGTVQFGLDYGINNKRGRIPKDEAFLILSKACAAGISVLDTASAYGHSEEVIGEYISGGNRSFDIISKTSKCKPGQMAESIRSSLDKLHLPHLYGCLLHSFVDYKKTPAIWDELCALKNLGLVAKIGFSLYHVEEIDFLLQHTGNIDLIQVPYSVFDQRFEPYFKTLEERGIEIHVRSVFLQGLLFKDPSELQGYFQRIKVILGRLHDVASHAGIPLSALCVNFVALNEYVDKVIVGVDRVENMDELLQSARYSGHTEKVYDELKGLRVDDLNIILPTKWSTLN